MSTTSPIFFPTTILLIDDNREFLETLHVNLNQNNIMCYLFSDPYEALKEINASGEDLPIMDKITEFSDFSGVSVTEKKMDFSKILDFLNSSTRFEKVSTIVVDYSMPGMNGLELCNAIQNPSIQKILLTGEADERIAVEAFNAGLIQAYIKKTTENCSDKLLEVIKESQMKYLCKNEATSVDRRGNSPLKDPIFLKYFKGVLEQMDIAEYYPITSRFDFLLITKTGDLHILWVQDEEEAYSYYYEIQDFDEIEFPPNLKQDMKEHKKMLCFLPLKEKYPMIEKWPHFMQPATFIKGNLKNYLATVTNAEPYFSSDGLFNHQKYQKQFNSLKYWGGLR